MTIEATAAPLLHKTVARVALIETETKKATARLATRDEVEVAVAIEAETTRPGPTTTMEHRRAEK